MQSFLDVVKTGNDPLDCEHNMLTVSKDVYDNTAWEKHGIYELVDIQTEITIQRNVIHCGSTVQVVYTRIVGQIVIFYKLKPNFADYL